ncbi:MAG: nitric oxide synthase oxygenase [Pseudomonadota bacterium]
MNTVFRHPEGPSHEGDDEVVCHCQGITRAMILNTIARVGSDIDAITKATGAGSICGGCTPKIGQLAGQETMVPATLAEKEQLDESHWRLRFTLDEPMIAKLPASDLLLEVPLGGRAHARSYTITQIGASDVELTLRREPNGLISRWLCDEGDDTHVFQLSKPFGGVSFAPNTRPVFLTCGIGITPALSFIRTRRIPGTRLFWWLRGDRSQGLLATVQKAAEAAGIDLHVIDTSVAGTRLKREIAADWLRAELRPHRDAVHVCGPQGFLDTCVAAFAELNWADDRLQIASFAYTPGQGPGAVESKLHRVKDFVIPKDTITTPSFSLRAAEGVALKIREAQAFLKQFYYEIGATQPYADRLDEVTKSLRRDGTYSHTTEELAFGARLAWRNSNRCIGRYFWQSLTVRDRRDLPTDFSGSALAEAVFKEVIGHVTFGTNGGDLRPSITIFPPDRGIFIENPQVILYAGYENADGTVTGDPKNLALTRQAQALGWTAPGTPYDILPLMISIQGEGPYLFELPDSTVLEVPLTHPERSAVADLNLRWFALPAVANMALDLGGIVYSAAPSNGFYMGTEIGSFNLADPRRYDRMPAIAEAMGFDTSEANPLWRDQALLELNRAVMHSFRQNGVRILDHHELSRWFDRFRADESAKGRPVFGHWPWIVPPMSGNLSNVWHDASLKNVILKPGYFYQKGEDVAPHAHR